jgi:DNA-binding CsgD family transcriptional regulator
MATRHKSPIHLVRACSSFISFLQIGGGGLNQPLHLEAIKESLPHVDDPRIRSSAAYITAYGLSSAANYEAAHEWIDLWLEEARTFSLEFAMPYGLWVIGRIALGQRRYSETERALQSIEDIASRSGDVNQLVNARSLRARLLLQNADADKALRCVENGPPPQGARAWGAELIATRALVLSILGDGRAAVETANEALSATQTHEVTVLARVACAIAKGDPHESRRLIALATQWDIWDPVLCGARSSAEFARSLASDPATRGAMEALYSRARDVTLARRAGFRTRSTKPPQALLSPRESEVLGLIARGYTNAQISRALFISDSTTKVHVRHILEKLGVRTRTEAVARYEMFRSSDSGDSD